MIGQQLGNYRLVEHLGQSGMGAMYAGEHALMGNRVTVKILLPEYSHNKHLVHRFFDEARTANRIAHPGIVQVFEFGEQEGGTNYIIMEYMFGELLSSRLNKCGRIPLAVGLALMHQCASALAAAHRVGIVHRNLSPENILLCPAPDIEGGERVKLLDVGAARVDAERADGDAKAPDESVYFRAPEQCAGGARKADHRADLYALGCIGFAMLCGRPPFVHKSPGEVIAAHMFHEAPAATSLEPSIPLGVDSLLMGLLAKEPDQRYQSADEVARALEAAALGIGCEYASDPPSEPGSNRQATGPTGQVAANSAPALSSGHRAGLSLPRRTGRGPWLLVLALVIALIAVGAWVGSSSDVQDADLPTTDAGVDARR